jgi:hypothetical protein
MAKKSELEARIARLEADIAMLRAQVAQTQTPVVIQPQPAWPGTYPIISCETISTNPAPMTVMLKSAS